jgi:hypothetical protein
VGSVRAQQMSWFRLVWALEVARVWLVVFGCAAAGWAVGFGMRYRRGVNGAITGGANKPDHRLEGD